ncbi:MAG: hypothetical protein Q7U13_13210 [Rhodoferax sp.]|nr:hypothetical protein [Rhodoferax sp.]
MTQLKMKYQKHSVTKWMLTLALLSGYATAFATTFVAQFVGPQSSLAQGKPPSQPAPGLHVNVIDGMIQISNNGGTQNFSAGQFGYTRSIVQPPVVVPMDPGLRFTPPAAFSAPTPSNTGTGTNTNRSAEINCVVR